MQRSVVWTDEMRSKTKLFALAATVMLALTVFAPAATATVATAGNDAGNGSDAGNTEDDAGNAPTNETNGSFGMQVSEFVHKLMSSDNVSKNETFGQVVSDWVVANNPGAEKRPDHAGKPEQEGPKAGNASGNSGDPPGQAGNAPGNSGNGGGNGGGHGGGPPDHANGKNKN